MPVKKSLIINRKSSIEKTTRAKRQNSLSVPIYSLTGRPAGTMTLPKEIFGQEVNEKLLAQAVRVYSTNQKSHFAHTKTRGEVKGSTAKAWSQKGTGRARHGAKSAPIFVGGGVALGPKYRKTILELPKKMKTQALISALSQKVAQKEVVGMSGIEKASGKTLEMAKLLKNIGKQSALIILGSPAEKAVRATRNIPNLHLLPADQLSALEVIMYQALLLSKEAVEKLEKRLNKESK